MERIPSLASSKDRQRLLMYERRSAARRGAFLATVAVLCTVAAQALMSTPIGVAPCGGAVAVGFVLALPCFAVAAIAGVAAPLFGVRWLAATRSLNNERRWLDAWRKGHRQ